ncbi:hypothetical protein [Niabella drilacis]|uniref:Uncharacterized protein n=1 Tax=Niabella drilacis (strain DSM 25811 / CCM 8410 / CCUG 62505 / LMG 26954 / E90) TaxID=1285928 RepID=A0A1G6PPF5_NIADE|nr:hypothetical protein [Niabella drilacis]SDC82043.1 hypothetical protein SAMN04487894_104116 [Niabella drilacis]
MQLILSGVTIDIELHAIHIHNDEPLWKLLSKDPEQNTELLVAGILQAYETQYHRKLEIAPGSLAVEIWGHVYIDQFADYTARLTDLNLVKKLLYPVQKYCAVIDCGEKDHDTNRWFWDLLAPLKATIGGWLPKEAKTC